MTPYRTIAALAEDEFEEKRSRFLCAAVPVKTEKEAAAFLAARRAEHYDARHTVYAYVLREGNAQRCSDDGEPQGTGGMPVLEVIRRAGLVDVCVAVTRYFGGILLGAGGLTRAYARGAALAVAAAEVVTMQPCIVCRIRTDYALYGTVSRLLNDCGAKLLDTDFGVDVTINARVAQEDYAAFCRTLTEATSASVSAEETGRVFAAL